MSRNPSSESSKPTPTSSHNEPTCSKAGNLKPKKSNNEGLSSSSSGIHSKYHFNTIWSLWYCFLTTLFTSFLVYKGIRRFLMYASLPWPDDDEPYMELNAQVGLVGAAVVVMPFFVVSSVIKVGNLSNDGFKLGSSLSTCSRDPPAVLAPSTGVIRNLWMHGVPTSPFLHLIAAFCLLFPQTLMGAALIKAGFLPIGEIWKSDLSHITTHERGGSGIMVGPTIGPNDTIVLQQPLASTLPPLLIMKDFHNYGDRPSKSTSVFGSGKSLSRTRRSNVLSQETGRLSPSYTPPNIPASFLVPPSSSIGKRTRNRVSVQQNSGGVEDSGGEIGGKSSIDSSSGRTFSFLSLHLEELSWNTFSPELINYVIALVIFAIRYPSVFWHTNKMFSFLFSLQMIFTGVLIVLTIDAFTILYKFQVNASKTAVAKENSFLSNPISSILLLVLAVLTLTVSSSALYFYGYQRFTAFLERSRKRFHITYSSQPLVMRPHTAQLGALAIFLCLGISMGPLLWDFTSLYKKSSGNCLILSTIITSVTYLCLWVLLWIFLSCKSSWIFKLRVSVARAFVSSARSIKLVNDVEMSKIDEDDPQAPILVVGGGRAVAVKDNGPKKAIMGVVNKFKEDKKQKGQEEEIYWLKPTLNLSFDRGKYGGRNQAKVTFNDLVEEKYSARKNLLKGQFLSETEDDDDEAGDYAILHESFPAYVTNDESEMSPSGESDLSQRSPMLEDQRYVDRKQILAYQNEANARAMSSADSSPVLMAPDFDDSDHLNEGFHGQPTRHQVFIENQGSVTPRSTRSNDSGVPVETPSQRSDSLSSNSSHLHTPPDHSDESGLARNGWTYNEDERNPLPHGQPIRPSRSSSFTKVHGGSSHSPADSTVAIRRQRHMTQEIRPPTDPIYGSRKTTSFSPYEGNSFFHSPLSPLPPLPETEGGEHCTSPDLPPPPPQNENYGGENGGMNSNHHVNYPQIPLPPIPQGMMPPPPMEPLEPFRNSHTGIYGRTSGVYPLSEGIYGKARYMGRSSSLRHPSNHGNAQIQKQYTNTFPHVLRRESQYNTNV